MLCFKKQKKSISEKKKTFRIYQKIHKMVEKFDQRNIQKQLIMSISQDRRPPHPTTTIQQRIVSKNPLNTSHNDVTQSFRDDQVHDLMSSIQNKLSMLVFEDSCDGSDFEISKLNSPKRQYLTATDEKVNNRAKITLNDLSTSNYRKNKKEQEELAQHHQQEASPSPSKNLGQPRVLGRINAMEQFYMSKIQDLSTKISSLEFDYEALQKKYHQVNDQNRRMKKQLEEYGYKGSREIDMKVEEFKKELVRKFSDEAQQHFQQHIKEMKELNDELSNERSKRRFLENQVTTLTVQKQNLEEFYRNLLHDHRNMIRLDVQKLKNKQNNSYSNHKDRIDGNQGMEGNLSPEATTAHKKTKRKAASKHEQPMTKQEMIPFLAKGIQDLKDKLKIK